MMHAVAAYRNKQGELHFLDVNAGGAISDRPPAARGRQFKRFAWAVPPFDELELKALARYCDRVARAQPRFQYSFLFPPGAKIAEYQRTFALLEGAIGVTRATFVIALMARLDLDLLDLESWEPRDEDAVAMQIILNEFVGPALESQLTAADASAAVAARQSEIDMPCKRYRPEELIAACQLGRYPAAFADVAPVGADAKRWLEKTREMLVATNRLV